MSLEEELDSITGTNERIQLFAKVAVLSLFMMSLFSCGSSKYLSESQKYLQKNSYELITDDERVNKKQLINNLRGLVNQKPQKKSVLNPRTWGKPLTIYNQEETDDAIEKFTKFLQNRKGFYEANVIADVVEKGDAIQVTYRVDLGTRHYVKSIKIESTDTTLVTLLENENKGSLIKPGDPLDGSLFEKELGRVINVAKDNGYADFAGNFIEFRGDSLDYDVDVTSYIYTPVGANRHTKYRIGKIDVFTQHLRSVTPQFSFADTIDDKVYYSKSRDFVVAPKVLHKVMPLQSGNLFSRNTEIRTNRNLTRLSPYRFVDVTSRISTLSDSLYDYQIFLTPYESKWIFDTGGNLFFSVLNEGTISNEDLLGFSGNVGFENRNFANKAVRHRFGLEGSFEFEIPSLRSNTVSVQFNNSFELPGVVDIFNTGSFLNWVGLLTDKSYNGLNYDGSTKFDFNVGLTNFLDFYNLNFIEAALSYNFQPSPNARYTLKQIGINVLDTDIKPAFEEIFRDNQLLKNSFESYLLTGFLFRELTMYRRSKEAKNGSYFAFIGSLESSGFENFLINGFTNLTNITDNKWQIAGLEVSQFVKFNTDLRFTLPVKERSSFAARVNFGMIIPYGQTSDGRQLTAPYIKQFFVGGPNSIRGWQIRELGPGTYNHIRGDENEPFFQAGDIKFEMNAEYRFDLFYIFEGAIFVDAGNVWTLSNDQSRPGSQISSSFLNQLAVSSGWGIRMDFDYFLFRFDFGYKLRTPFEDPETGKKWFAAEDNILGNVNFAIYYPF